MRCSYYGNSFFGGGSDGAGDFSVAQFMEVRPRMRVQSRSLTRLARVSDD